VIRQLVGDCRQLLPTLEPGSVQSCITSIPYWWLRDYGTPPLVWGGDAEHKHEWAPAQSERRIYSEIATVPGLSSTVAATAHHVGASRANARLGSFCPCGAWLGSLGLEPTPELFVEHVVECFRHVWRVLHEDAVLWLNIGDSYAGSGNGAHDYRERNKNRSLSLHTDKYVGQSTRSLQRVGPQEHTEGTGRVPGYKPKDLMEIPSLVALALRADGWYLRSRIPWLKRNCMPESTTDRPTSAIEYVFLFAKSRRYFWDKEAARMGVAGNAHSRGDGMNPKSKAGKQPSGWDTKEGSHDVIPQGRYRPRQNASFSGATNELVDSRNRRNSDWFFESWQGLLTDDDGEPLALVVNPQPFSGAHFATFPPRLVEPMIRASTHPGDTVLDPFGGSGTVGLVARRLGRNAVLCELKPDYSVMAQTRITSDAPLFAQVEVAAD